MGKGNLIKKKKINFTTLNLLKKLVVARNSFQLSKSNI